MKSFMLLAALTISFTVCAQNKEVFFLSNPCLTPDGQTVVFSFEGDLWTADVKTGHAVRLTAMPGYETNPRVSPDGKWVAFTGREYGNADVFLIPMGGGEIKQLTFHSGDDEVSSWSWDSQNIYFTSNRMGQPSGFKMSKNGGTPQRVFGNYFFQYDHNLFEHPTSGEIFFNDTWESNQQVQRKRYKGPFNPDIQSYNIHTKQYKRYTDYKGKDFGATIDKNGKIYFVSDEANGEYNLYTLDNGKKTALTNFPSSIKIPIVNANGGWVVFEKDYQLYVYDVAAGKSARIDISIFRNNVLPKEKDFDVKNSITNFDVSPDGKKMAFTARGELFVSDVEGKFIQQIKKGSAERAREVKWMSDNKTLLFNQTAGGYRNWFTIAADGSAPLKQITNEKRSNRFIVLNKTKTKAVYLSGRDEVRLLDLKTMESKTIVKDEIWSFQNAFPGFSPNGEYVIFTAHRNFEEDIFVHQLASGKTINLTNTAVTETNPIWSPDGKYIYFSATRTSPSYPMGAKAPKVYRMPLEKFDEPYRMDKYDDLFKKDSVKKDSSIRIDTDNIMERLEQVSPSFGSQDVVAVQQKGEKTTVLYTSNHELGKTALWKTTIEPFEPNKTEKIAGTESGEFAFAESSDKYYLLFNGTICKLNMEALKAEPVNLSYTFRRNLSAEFNQLFEEAWALMEENYYDENFHGTDWLKVKERYRRFLPYVNNRSDVRVLMNDMLGELNSSHQGFSTFGEDENLPFRSTTMETGIIFEETDPYLVKYVVKRSAADRSGNDIKAGDELVKVNDIAVEKSTDRNYYFTRPSIDKELKLTFKRAGAFYELKIHPQPTLFNNLYDEWVDNNQHLVDQKSNGRIAYGYMKNMGAGELEKFLIHMTQELTNKDALIFDLRYNTGGNVHDEVLKFLSQHAYLQWKYREGKMTKQGNFTPADKPIVLLVNEQSLSDAEMTAQGFKALKLGKIIGNDTYHWIIFTSGQGLVDGSFVRLPSWGCYTLEGKDLEATGVQPDISVINTFTDKISGKDPQLEKAVEDILKQLK
jgi:tricorn protease